MIVVWILVTILGLTLLVNTIGRSLVANIGKRSSDAEARSRVNDAVTRSKQQVFDRYSTKKRDLLKEANRMRRKERRLTKRLLRMGIQTIPTESSGDDPVPSHPLLKE